MSEIENYPELTKFISKIAKHENIVNYSVTITQKNDFGGFMGDIFFVTIKNNNNVVLDLVFKVSKILDGSYDKMATDACNNEITFYSKIYGEINKIQSECISYNFLESIPKCYGVEMYENKKPIALENLLIQGYEVPHIQELLDKSQIKLALKHLAYIHVLGFIFKQKRPNEFRDCKQSLNNFFIDLIERIHFRVKMNYLFNTVQDLVNNTGNVKMIKKYNEFVKNFVEIFLSCLQYNGQYGTFVHGDCWTNNLMYKYKEEGNKNIPVGFKILDWQTTHYGSPVIDLSYLLFSSMNKKDLDNMEEFLDYYYCHFSKVAETLGYDSRIIYPFDVFKSDWKYYGRYGFIMNTTATEIKLSYDGPLLHTDYKATITQDEMFELFNKRINMEEYRTRIFNSINYVYEEGLLECNL